MVVGGRPVDADDVECSVGGGELGEELGVGFDFAAGSDSMCWAIWTTDGKNLISIAVIRERPNEGSPHHSQADLRYLARAA